MFTSMLQCINLYMNKHTKAQNSSKFNIAHISKFVVRFNLIVMSKPKYIVILTCHFCSVVASGTSHFNSFYP